MSEYQNYTVKDGDTLTGIAHKFYGQSNQEELSQEVGALAKTNHIANPNLIHTGDQLTIPALNEAAGGKACFNWAAGDSSWKHGSLYIPDLNKTVDNPAEENPDHHSMPGFMAQDAAIGAGLGTAAGLLGGPFAEITVPVGATVGAIGGALVGAANYLWQEITE